MEDDLLKDWEKFKLTDDENKVIGVNGEIEDVDESKEQLRLVLVGKLWTVKTFNVEAMKRTLLGIWRLDDNVAIKMVDTNLFVFQFFSEPDKNRIIEGSLWFFDGKLLVLKDIQGGEQPSEVVFDKSPMWIRLLDVPFNRRNSSTMYDIGESLGGFLEFDDSDPLGWSEFMRLKIIVDVRKPLRRGVFIATGNSQSKWIDIK
uniref:DUF4283 domain-containing protein n=1 Tax=Chenopodium quinoa TaxID=63459 RepID=A0A803KWR0_CHEQI